MCTFIVCEQSRPEVLSTNAPSYFAIARARCFRGFYSVFAFLETDCEEKHGTARRLSLYLKPFCNLTLSLIFNEYHLPKRPKSNISHHFDFFRWPILNNSALFCLYNHGLCYVQTAVIRLVVGTVHGGCEASQRWRANYLTCELAIMFKLLSFCDLSQTLSNYF